ncbi:hypothetical protein G6O69_36200 [Pseudenhygromyxa sp. WMMC2535]|uniref:hypothetical protein n=1 Tax=Pseudenhygromyxa sp. WMMC2535 TaxID=2712867 RepID=UPI001595A070|nr:hypothetical protein [Pseudenhygromyxa sp. WMMC2535]NVB43324.1 hypothetical protein [Pseudenhygromyxa sp. WMMC2535]
MQIRSRASSVVLALSLAIIGCADNNQDPPACAQARILAIAPQMVTPTGRVLVAGADGSSVSQLEADGELTSVATDPASRPSSRPPGSPTIQPAAACGCSRVTTS